MTVEIDKANATEGEFREEKDDRPEKAPETAIAVRASEVTSVSLSGDPERVMAEAHKAAAILMDAVKRKPDPVMMNGEHYLEFEDWQTVARFYNASVRIVKSGYVEYGDVKGFEAYAEVIRNSDGMVIGSAEAACLNDEPKWRSKSVYEYIDVNRVPDDLKDKIVETLPSKYEGRPDRAKVRLREDPVPLFQLRSMAQTRAGAKALRNVFAWVVVLAGIKPTPWEELEGMIERGETTPAAAKSKGPDVTDMPEWHTVKDVREVLLPPKGSRTRELTKYVLVTEGGYEFGTFKKSITDKALKARDAGQKVRLGYKVTQWGLDLEEVLLDGEDPAIRTETQRVSASRNPLLSEVSAQYNRVGVAKANDARMKLGIEAYAPGNMSEDELRRLLDALKAL